jgi:AraC-like DNA-binding protein
MDLLTIAFHAISLSLALLAALLLLFVNQERRYSSRLLASMLIIFAWQNLVFLLLFTRLIIHLPWVLRIGAPTTFLIGPITFLYFRSILKDESSFKRSDGLLLIPAVLTIINFIPYFLLPLQEKVDYLNRNFYGKRLAQDPGAGFIPGNVYYIIRICWSGIFIYGCIRLLLQFKKHAAAETWLRNKTLLKWLRTFLTLLSATWLATILRLFIPTLKDSLVGPADLLFGATVFYICFQLFLRPQILYGVFQPLPGDVTVANTEAMVSEDMVREPVTPVGQNMLPAGKPVDLAEQLQCKRLVESTFQERLVFLHHDYSLDQLVRDTKIPRYLLSAFINREYGMGFREFLNRRRLEYMTENFDRPEWRNFTLEAKAMESGFSNRITFFKNLKQFTGKTPTEYFKTDPGPVA